MGNDIIEFKTGDILHCQGSKWLAKAIRFFTKSIYSHTALVVAIDGRPFIIDAQKDGVQLRSFENWVKDYNYKFTVNSARYLADDGQKVKDRAFSKIGTTGYDFEGLIIKSPIKLLTGSWRKKSNEDERMFCSEFVMWVYGVSNSYEMNPQEAYDWCKENNFIEILNTI